jgi:hypothetical protein
MSLRLWCASFSTLQVHQLENRMTVIETRFDTILPTLATKEDVKNLDLKLTTVIHHEISTIRQEMNANNWRMIIWMTAVLGMAFSGVFYIARYAA